MQVTELIINNLSTLVYSNEKNSFNPKDMVVIRVNDSEELATIKSKFESNEQESVEILRAATKEDYKQFCDNCHYSRTLLPQVKEEAEKLNLDMKISHVTVSLDRTKTTVCYTADDRVDFRDLIKVLAGKFKSRIEMKQIGNRDETRILGSLGCCGREVCCKAYLRDFDKVSIKMAKNQNIALNPQRINGMCGRLLCCLKYEDAYYDEMQKIMPKMNSYINTPNGRGQVTAQDFLRATVTVSIQKDDESTEIKTYKLDELNITPKDKKQ